MKMRVFTKYTVIALLFAFVAGVLADDTEIYTYTNISNNAARPKVLIVFDNSGSMFDNSVATTAEPYDPSKTYSGSADSNKIYWSEGSSDPSLSRYFFATQNRCESSVGPLANVGYYQDKVLKYRQTYSKKKKYAGKWEKLDKDEHSPAHVDCKSDVTTNNSSNPGYTSGYPRVTEKSNSKPDPYTANKNDSNADWSQTYILYSGNYVNYKNSAGKTSRTRIAIAKDVVTDIIDANPGMDFGMMVFNLNNKNSGSYDGGRVVHHLGTGMTSLERQNLINMIDGLSDKWDTWTPLCETYYEAYRYLSGDEVLYGNEAGNYEPKMDSAAVTGNKYNAPTSDCQYTYVIYMTDGEPTYDLDANTRVEKLTGQTCKKYGSNVNCLPELAEYLYTTDLDGDPKNGKQKAVTYTIGFATDQKLLSDTAAKGGGKYYTAEDSAQLTAAFQGIISQIYSTSSTFTSPSVAVNTFNRTQSRDDVFMAMFLPEEGPRWAGNIKKLKIKVSNNTANLVDKNGDLAIDSATGQISSSATTFWSTTADGDKVTEGGAGALLAARDPATRAIKTNTGDKGALEDFTFGNLDDPADYGFTNGTPTPTAAEAEAALYAHWDVADSVEMADLISWARGVDVDDENGAGNIRPWILGDMLHSRPLALNYGARGGHSVDDPDIRLLVGTNEGFFHMFDAGTGDEHWAFFPKELAPILNVRRENLSSSDHLYGIDSSAVAYTYDKNGDGTLDHAAGDKAYVFFGLRRGGNAYYALDVSNPDSPAFLWKIDDETAGFEELGQTWSEPVTAKIPGYSKPVIIFGGGYDTNKDIFGVATPDSVGRGIFIVDAESGKLVWSVTPGANSATNMQEVDLEHSVAAKVTKLDANGDGLTDRIYFADTGGNLWRVDLPGDSLPTSAQNTWHIVKLLSANGGTTTTDRRFFNQPDVVRTRDGASAYDAVLIGSGNRAHPNDVDVQNRFYMIEDRQTNTYFDSPPTSSECGTDANPGTKAGDFRCKLPLSDGAGQTGLYDATANLVQDGTTAQQDAASVSLADTYGWFIDLERTGEKSLSRATTISGTVFFTTFVPETGTSANICEPIPGTGYLYAVDLQDASAVFDFSSNGSLTKVDRIVELGNMIPDTPTPHFGPDSKIRLIFPSGGGPNGQPNPFDTGKEIQGAAGIYWYQEEY